VIDFAFDHTREVHVHVILATPAGKSHVHFATPSTSKVESHLRNMPKVDTACGKVMRYNVFLYHETISKRNFACESLTCDLARIRSFCFGCISSGFRGEGLELISSSFRVWGLGFGDWGFRV
jgi:hypothetical protein